MTMGIDAEGIKGQPDCCYKPNNKGKNNWPSFNSHIPGMYLFHKVNLIKQRNRRKNYNYRYAFLIYFSSLYLQIQMYMKMKNKNRKTSCYQ